MPRHDKLREALIFAITDLEGALEADQLPASLLRRAERITELLGAYLGARSNLTSQD